MLYNYRFRKKALRLSLFNFQSNTYTITKLMINVLRYIYLHIVPVIELQLIYTMLLVCKISLITDTIFKMHFISYAYTNVRTLRDSGENLIYTLKRKLSTGVNGFSLSISFKSNNTLCLFYLHLHWTTLILSRFRRKKKGKDLDAPKSFQRFQNSMHKSCLVLYSIEPILIWYLHFS